MKYYPFELHTHTVHSDGRLTVEKLVEYAKSRGLAGMAKTDHNTSGGNARFSACCKSAGLIPIEGVEITNTERGDATVYGKTSADDAEMILEQLRYNMLDKLFPIREFEGVAEVVKAGGGSVGYAHPCRYGLNTLGNYDELSNSENVETTHIEVWNGPNIERSRDSENAMRLYFQILRKRPIAVVSGADFHSPTVLGADYSITYLGMDGDPNSDKAVKAILNRKTYAAYGWKLSDNDSLLQAIGASVGAGIFSHELNLDRLSPPLTGMYPTAIVPHEVQIISCEQDGYFIIGNEKIEVSDNGKTANAYISADLKAGTRIVLRVFGAADGMRTEILLTSPIEVV